MQHAAVDPAELSDDCFIIGAEHLEEAEQPESQHVLVGDYRLFHPVAEVEEPVVLVPRTH